MSSLFRTGHLATKMICGGQTSAAAPITVSHRSRNAVPDFDWPTEALMPHKSSTGRNSGIYGSVCGAVTCAYNSKGINVSSRRLAHTDVSVPNFDSYRIEECLDPDKPARATEDGRRFTPYSIFYGVGGAISLLAVKEFVQKSVLYKSMAADQRALACIEVNLNEVAVGQTKTYEWQGKPVFVKHRTEEEIKREQEVALSELRHPESDQQRVQKDEWSVVIGICTHLGCVPIANAGDFGGYYCPCHGSHYDGSGRIRRGPAPLNLTVPKYEFKGDTMVIG